MLAAFLALNEAESASKHSNDHATLCSHAALAQQIDMV